MIMSRNCRRRGAVAISSSLFILHTLYLQDVSVVAFKAAFNGQSMLPGQGFSPQQQPQVSSVSTGTSASASTSTSTSKSTGTTTSCSAALTSSLETSFAPIVDQSPLPRPPVEQKPKTKTLSEVKDIVATVSATATAIENTKTNTNSAKNKNIFEESFVLLSRATEVSSIALGTVTPLLISGLSSTIFSNNSHENYISLGSEGEEIKSVNDDPWEKFWSIETPKISLSNNNNNNNDMMISNADRVVEALQKLGPTYVKFGQALGSRPDIIPQSLAEALCTLQDAMEPFDTDLAKQIIEDELLLQLKPKEGQQQTNIGTDDDVTFSKDDIQSLINSFSDEPVAAASVGQVYKGYLPNYGPVAVKVQRPGIQELVEKDFSLLRSFASFVESIPSPSFNLKKNDDSDNSSSKNRLINTELVAAVDEFMSRLFEELNYENEAANAKKFAELYCKKNGSRIKSLPNGQGVIVPEILTSLCTKNVIVMEWIEGRKLTAIGEGVDENVDVGSINPVNEIQENLALIEHALYVTLSQLLDTGVMHADPHGGNLLKVSTLSSSLSSKSLSVTSGKPIPTLAYLDFGLLATIPVTVRDGLVCAVASLVFAKDVETVASLFGELDLLPEEVINDPVERKALTEALRKTMEEVLKYPPGETLYSSSSSTSPSTLSLSKLGNRINLTRRRPETTIPALEFDKLLDGLTRLVPRFKFRLPPYFINNARALGTLEGTARSLDPEFNCLKVMYPYALYRLLQNPSGSHVVRSTLQSLIRSNETGRVDREKVRKLLRDTALFTGFSRRKVLMDILKTSGGKRLIARSLASEFNHMVLRPMIQRSKRIGLGGKYSAYLQL